jgi:hypothetical protein
MPPPRLKPFEIKVDERIIEEFSVGEPTHVLHRECHRILDLIKSEAWESETWGE